MQRVKISRCCSVVGGIWNYSNICYCLQYLGLIQGMYLPRIWAASICLSGHIGAVNWNTAGAVITTDKPCGCKIQQSLVFIIIDGQRYSLFYIDPYSLQVWGVGLCTQGNCATEGNSGNCQSGNCHSGERWMRKPSVHCGKWKSNEGIDNIANGPVNNMSFFML